MSQSLHLAQLSQSFVRTFGVTQGVIAALIGATIYLRWRRDRDRDAALDIKLEHIQLFRAGARRGPELRKSQPKPQPKSEQLESALPAWDRSTPASVVLGVREGALSAEVEAAYKRVLKRYHPDRFAAWGKGYQQRAHLIVLLAQEARDKLLKPRS